MDDIKRTIKDLNELPEKRAALVNIPEKIKILEMRFGSIKAAKTDGDPVTGGTFNREDMLIQNIEARAELKKNLEITRKEVALLEKALDSLRPNERRVLTRFYIYQEKRAAERLSAELGYEPAQIYRIKKAALESLARRLYGQVKSDEE